MRPTSLLGGRFNSAIVTGLEGTCRSFLVSRARVRLSRLKPVSGNEGPNRRAGVRHHLAIHNNLLFFR